MSCPFAKAILVLLLSVASLSPIQGADRYRVGDVLYVWAQSGLNLRKAPQLNAPKVDKLAMGVSVKVLAKTSQALRLAVIAARPEQAAGNIFGEPASKDPFVLEGHWVKVQSGATVGYVADIYLLSWPALPEATTPWEYTELLTEDQLIADTTWLQGCEGGPAIDCYEWKAASSTGIEFSGDVSLVSVYQGFRLPDMTVEEGFVFWNVFIPIGDAERRKAGLDPLTLLQGEEGNLWLLENEVCELSITLEDDRIYCSSGCSD